MPTLHLLIKGKVQGVFYRATAKDVADELGLTGWVKNTRAGDVEAVVSGSDEQVQKFITWCRKGPRRAEVTEVAATELHEEAFAGFSVVR